MLREEEGLAARVLESLDITVEEVRAQVARIVGQGDEVTTGQIPFTPRAKVLSWRCAEALSLGHNYIGTEHILLGLVRENEGVAAHPARLRRRRREDSAARSSACSPARAGSSEVQGSGEKAKSSKLLDQFGRNLTKAATDGKLDPVVGRQTEIERVMQILSRRQKNNPVLISASRASARPPSSRASPPGSPPTRYRAPEEQADLHARPAALVAGSKYRGEFEERLKKVKEIMQRATSSSSSTSSITSSAPARRRRDRRGLDPEAGARPRRGLQTIGATTLDEYRKYLERDAALERASRGARRRAVDRRHGADPARPARSLRGAPSLPDLRRRAPRRVELADRYIRDRRLPDKAIDLIDEASSRLRIKTMTAPPRYRELEDEIERVRTEKENAIESREFEKAASLRDKERKLTQKKKELERAGVRRSPRSSPKSGGTRSRTSSRCGRGSRSSS